MDRRNFMRVVAISDPHCGALYGLTPPAWQVKEKKGGHTQRNKWATLQRSLWGHYDSLLKQLGPIDVVLFGGDAIDGSGKRSGGTELITTDREEQSDMAVACFDHIRLYGKKKIKMVGVFGTPYHTGQEEDWESIVADRAGFEKIGSHEWPEVNGLVFDLKHKIGSSSIPHGRATALLRDMLWNELWAVSDQQPKADIVLRGHVHYSMFAGEPGKLGMTLPALCGMGSKFGARQCSGIVHFGLTHFDISSKGELLDWGVHTVVIEEQKAKVIKL